MQGNSCKILVNIRRARFCPTLSVFVPLFFTWRLEASSKEQQKLTEVRTKSQPPLVNTRQNAEERLDIYDIRHSQISVVIGPACFIYNDEICLIVFNCTPDYFSTELSSDFCGKLLHLILKCGRFVSFLWTSAFKGIEKVILFFFSIDRSLELKENLVFVLSCADKCIHVYSFA